MELLPESKSRHAHWLTVGSLLAVGLLAFWPTVGFDFVNWDDPAYVRHNDLIKSWSPANLYGVVTETVTRNYAPLTITTLLFDHTVWGMNPSGYHATNVILHLINGILVYLLARQLTGSRFTGWLTAALFLVHPVQIETVAWISSRKGLLSATFMLSALIVRLKPSEDAQQDLSYFGWLAAALLSKALAIVIPPIVLLYDILVLKRKFSDALVRQIIPGLMGLLLLFKTMASQNSIMGGLRGHMDFSLLQILAVDSTLLWRYIGMLVWPNDLCVLYDPPTTGITTMVVFASLGWVAVAGILRQRRQQNPLVVWAALTALLLMMPVLNFIRITTLMNDRYLYLPCVLFFGTVAAGLNWLLNVAPSRDRLERVVAAVTRWSVSMALITGALLVTLNHLPVWQNSHTLWNHAMQHVPHLPVVRIQLALTHHDQGRTREAIGILERAMTECRADELDQERIQTFVSQWSEEVNSQTAGRLLLRR